MLAWQGTLAPEDASSMQGFVSRGHATVGASSGGNYSPAWAKIGDRALRQDIQGGEVDILKFPMWFLASRHPLGRSLVTHNLKLRCTPEENNGLIESRAPVDWWHQLPKVAILMPFTSDIDASLGNIGLTCIVSDDEIQQLNHEFIFARYRSNFRCRIANWDVPSPTLSYTNEFGFVLVDACFESMILSFLFTK